MGILVYQTSHHALNIDNIYDNKDMHSYSKVGTGGKEKIEVSFKTFANSNSNFYN